jgi:4-amino-4-deoxy-L-arabinose transferase-like glycosyltransferase
LSVDDSELSSPAAAPAIWVRALILPIVLHIALCLGLYQYGLSNAEMKQLQIDGPSRLITPYVRAVRVFGPLGALRTYLRGEQDEKLYLEYSKLLLLGHADTRYIAERQNDLTLLDHPLPARAWPYRDVRVEYPPLAFLATIPPALITTEYRAYRYAFAGYMLLLHGLNLWLAWRLLKPRPRAALEAAFVGRVLYTSLGFLFALGLVVVTRLDHLVLTATLLCLVAFDRAQRSAGGARLAWAAGCGALAGLGVMTKLVPGLAGLAVFALWLGSNASDRLRCALASAAAGALLVILANLGMYALAGDAYLATFRYHTLRGIQIESLYSGLLMLLRPFGLPMQVEESFGSTNLASPATGLIKPLSLALLAVSAGYLLCLRRWSADGRGALLLTCALLLAFILTSRVFSPQYLIWIGAPLCVLAAEQRRIPAGLWLFFAAVLMSQLIFPRGYPVLKAMHPLGIALLDARNLALVVVTVWLVRFGSQSRVGSR